MEFRILPLVAEIGATLAGLAAIAGVIRFDRVDLDAVFDIAAYGAIASLFSLGAMLFVAPPNGAVALRVLSFGLAVVSGAAAIRNIAVIARVRNDPEQHLQGLGATLLGLLAFILIMVTPCIALPVALNLVPSLSGTLYEAALLSSLAVALLLLVFVLWKHFVLR